MSGNLPVIKNIHSDDLYVAFEKCPSHSYVVRIPRPEPAIVAEENKENQQ
jgi:hypothetical protein